MAQSYWLPFFGQRARRDKQCSSAVVQRAWCPIRRFLCSPPSRRRNCYVLVRWCGAEVRVKTYGLLRELLIEVARIGFWLVDLVRSSTGVEWGSLLLLFCRAGCAPWQEVLSRVCGTVCGTVCPMRPREDCLAACLVHQVHAILCQSIR